MLSCVLEITEDIDNIERLFVEKLETKKAKCTITKKKDSLILKINANDPVAMKAILNSILSTIQVYHKAKEIK